jgi:hypothetical protein
MIAFKIHSPNSATSLNVGSRRECGKCASFRLESGHWYEVSVEPNNERFLPTNILESVPYEQERFLGEYIAIVQIVWRS